MDLIELQELGGGKELGEQIGLRACGRTPAQRGQQALEQGTTLRGGGSGIRRHGGILHGRRRLAKVREGKIGFGLFGFG